MYAGTGRLDAAPCSETVRDVCRRLRRRKNKSMRILGIDPGTNITGYGVIKIVGTVPELIIIGSIDLSKFEDHYIKLKHIFDRTI